MTLHAPPFLPFDTVAVIGVGMMGGSIGLEMRQRQLARRVVGIDLHQATLRAARDKGCIDIPAADMQSGVTEADCVVVAAPVGAIPQLLAQIALYVPPESLVTDLGSTKRSIVVAGEESLGKRFVGGHPMAGSPVQGLAGVRAGLFEDAAWAVVRSVEFTLSEEADPFAMRLAELAVSLGARPISMDAARHDRLVALVSHLPHVIAFAFSALIAENPDADLARALAGGSYQDLMRVAGADPALWNDIFHDNREELSTVLAGFVEKLDIDTMTGK